MMETCLMMVSLVPNFPMPGIGPEVGYFYCYHKAFISAAQKGLRIGLECNRFNPSPTTGMPLWAPKLTEPVNPLILIWPDSVQPNFTKKTISHYGLIVSSVAEAIAAVQANLAQIQKVIDYKKEMEQVKIRQYAGEDNGKRVYWRREKKEHRYGSE